MIIRTPTRRLTLLAVLAAILGVVGGAAAWVLVHQIELITNAAKYAYEDKPGGKIWVRLDRTGDNEITLSVRDEGQGLPDDVDPLKAKSFGMRIISSFAKQLRAKLSFKSGKQGTEFSLKVPLSTK